MPTRRLQVQVSFYPKDLEQLDDLVRAMNQWGHGNRPNRSATLAKLVSEEHGKRFPAIPEKRSRKV